MQIEVDLRTSDGPRVVAPDDFKSFKVLVRGGTDVEQARRALAPVAEWLGDDHVAIAIDSVRSLAGDAARAPEWEQGFAGMIGYAQTKGWIVGDAIKAHVEWVSG